MQPLRRPEGPRRGALDLLTPRQPSSAVARNIRGGLLVYSDMAQSPIRDEGRFRQSAARFSELVTIALGRIDAKRSRALVPVTHATSRHELDQFSGLGATFLAHLIATRDRAPQTLGKNRSSTEEAITSYEHSAAHDDPTIPIKES